MYFVPPLKGFPLELGISTGCEKKLVMGLSGGEKKFDDIFSRVDIPGRLIHQLHDRWTDRHRATAKTALTHSVAR